WQQVLRLPRVSVHDNFFEIGGHSLLVVQLMTRIEQVLHVGIPVIELYKHPTVAALAEYVVTVATGSDTERSASPLVVLSARDSGTPLVVIPGIIGALHGYYDFARAVGESRPVFGLHASSAREIANGHTVESIARLYVSSLHEVWDGGPLHLLGHSYGGIVAFEMVRQLEEQGHQPRSLILVDVDPLALRTKDLAPDIFALQYMLKFLRIDDVVPRDLEPADGEDVASLLDDLATRHHQQVSSGRQHLAEWIHTIRSRYTQTYAPAPYQPAADILHVWAQHGASLHGASEAWKKVLRKETDRVVVPGDHESLISREHATQLARTVNAWIAGGLKPE
ncbi:MAG: thioesterase domain-containing protein, partial [Acidobacteriota bacterium]